MQYTTVMHMARKYLRLSTNDYCVADMIDLLAQPSSPRPGWCVASRQHMADEMDLSRQSVITIIQKLEEKRLVMRSETDDLRTTDLWKNTVSAAIAALEKGVNFLDTLSSFLTPEQRQWCKETLQQGVKKLDTPCKETLHPACKETLHLPVKKLDTYNKSENESRDNKINKDDVDVENAHDPALLNSKNLDAEGGPPPPQIPAAPPAPKKKYGDGKLQQEVRQYYLTNPDTYPIEMAPDFLDWYTEILQNSDRQSDIGKERWRALDTWNLAKKLAKWHTNYLNDQKSKQTNEPSQNPQYVNGSAARATGHGTGTGNRTTGQGAGNNKPAKRPATVKPGMFNRNGQSRRDDDRDGRRPTIRIDVDPDHQTAGDQTQVG